MIPVALLQQLLPTLLGLVLASLRLTPCLMLLPFLGGRSLPAQTRFAITLVLALGVSPSLLHTAPTVTSVDAWLLVSALRELSVGVVLALVLATPWFALEHAGRVLDIARGANAAEVIAPDSGARVSPLSELLRMTAVVVFLGAGGHRAVIRAIAASFVAVPLRAQPSVEGTGRLVELAARATQASLTAALSLASAGLLALVAMELVLAVSARLSAPLGQANLAVPLKALGPIAALALTAGLWTGAARELGANALRAVAVLTY